MLFGFFDVGIIQSQTLAGTTLRRY